jgi:hypothetical protein
MRSTRREDNVSALEKTSKSGRRDGKDQRAMAGRRTTDSKTAVESGRAIYGSGRTMAD